jgi:hypothetical protein
MRTRAIGRRLRRRGSSHGQEGTPEARRFGGDGLRAHDPRQPAQARPRRRAHPRQEGRGGAKDVKKVLQSAIANAENNHQLDVDRLYVAEASVGKAAVMKRFHARARGRASSVHKPFSNLTIVVRERAAEAKEKA